MIKHETLRALQLEMNRGRTKFPTNTKLLAGLTEEVGEVAKALLQGGNCQASRAEALQVAVVALRIYEEGDRDFNQLTDEEKQP